MALLTDQDEDADDEIIEEFAQDDAAPNNKKVQAKELKSGPLIGKGRSSIVYETTWRGQSYARKDFLRVPSDVFEREAAVLAALDSHPNVTRTHCWSVNEGSCSLVTDLMDDDLQNMMRNRRESAWRPSDDTSHVIEQHRFIEHVTKKNAPEERPVASTLVSSFSMSEALHLMLQIAEGVVFLHERGVAHGDLKPKNILVAGNERGGPSLKVADFGLVATKMKSKTLVSQRARKLEIARWRAPELFDKPYLLREEGSDSDWDSDSDGGKIHTYEELSTADVFSFAVTCAQILTGEDPYSGLGLRELVSKVSGPNSLRPGLPQRCPAQLSDLIIRCWGDDLKRPTFIDIRRELKDLQASLTSDSCLDIEETTITGPDFEVTLPVKFTSEKIAKNRYSETSAPTLPRRDLEITEAAGLPMENTYSIKSNEVLSSKLALVPKTRRRRKGYGCLQLRRRENEDITALKKRIAKAAVSKKSPFGEATSPNEKQYNTEIGRIIGAKPFTYAEVTAMTKNFETEIGSGGFGSVYYGKLPDGQEVAVRVGTSCLREQEFFNEIESLSRVRHKNLVALVGYCQLTNHRIMIYEYMRNGSLYDHLHGNKKRAGMLDWKMRLRIALNVAQGLEYLHTGCEQSFVHGDMKSSNVLLSSKYDAKVTDFGLTKPMGYSSSTVPIIMKGTSGYLDPEYYATNDLSSKSDIFSFGIVLMELITGRPVFCKTVSGTTQEHLTNWVRPALQEGDIDMVLDPALKSSVPAPNQEALRKLAELAMRCAEPEGVHRPILSEVIYELLQAMNLEGLFNESEPFTSGTFKPLNPTSWNPEPLVPWDSCARPSQHFIAFHLELPLGSRRSIPPGVQFGALGHLIPGRQKLRENEPVTELLGIECYTELNRYQYVRLSHDLAESPAYLSGASVRVLRKICLVANSSEEFFLSDCRDRWLRTAIICDKGDPNALFCSEEVKVKDLDPSSRKSSSSKSSSSKSLSITIHSKVVPNWSNLQAVRDGAVGRRLCFPSSFLDVAVAENRSLEEWREEWKEAWKEEGWHQRDADDDSRDQHKSGTPFWNVESSEVVVVKSGNCGKGSQAIVGKILWRGGIFARKVFKQEEEFYRELDVVRRVSHPHIVHSFGLSISVEEKKQEHQHWYSKRPFAWKESNRQQDQDETKQHSVDGITG